MLFALLGAMAGAFLALNNYPAFVLAPLAALFAAGVMVTGVASGQDLQTIAMEVFGSATFPQLLYLATALTAQQSQLAQYVSILNVCRVGLSLPLRART
jgi:hypothetical protein